MASLNAKRVAAASKVISYADRTLTKANRQFMAAAVRHATNNSAMSIKFNQRGQSVQAVLIFEPFGRSRPSRAPAAQTRPDAPPDVPPAWPDIDTSTPSPSSGLASVAPRGKRRRRRLKPLVRPQRGPSGSRVRRSCRLASPPRRAPHPSPSLTRTHCQRRRARGCATRLAGLICYLGPSRRTEFDLVRLHHRPPRLRSRPRRQGTARRPT